MDSLREKYMKIPKLLRFFVLRPLWLAILIPVAFASIPIVLVFLILREVLEAWHDYK